MNFESMTIDELEQYSVGLKRGDIARGEGFKTINDERLEIKRVRSEKILEAELTRKATHFSTREKRALLKKLLAEQGEWDSGDVVVCPAPAVLPVNGFSPEVA